MADKRIRVWVQHYADRPHLLLQWIDPDTGKRKSKSAETANEKLAEDKRADPEADLNAGRHRDASRMAWERFRELFLAEYAGALRENTRLGYEDTLDLFEELCRPTRIDLVSARTVSAFAAAMRTRPTRGRSARAPSPTASSAWWSWPACA
jgi:hypothetical protein